MTTLLQILRNTPTWVFALFLLLLVLGLRQMRDAQVHPTRFAIMPLAMGGLSFHGVVSAFGFQPAPLSAWLAGAAITSIVLLRTPLSTGARYDAATHTLHLPGSAAPLALMMAIFFTRYAVSVALALHPALRHQTSVALAAAALYGSFSGLLAGQALRVGRHVLHARVHS